MQLPRHLARWISEERGEGTAAWRCVLASSAVTRICAVCLGIVFLYATMFMGSILRVSTVDFSVNNYTVAQN